MDKFHFFQAVESNKKEEIEQFLNKGLDINVTNSADENALMVALEQEHVDLALFLVEQGIDVNTPDLGGDTPLFTAIRQGELELIQALVSKGADVNVVNDFGENPLCIATSNKHVDIMAYLIEQGANMNVVEGMNGFTPLILSVYNKSYDGTKLLLEKGADGSIRSKSGISSIEFMLRLGEEEQRKAFLLLFIDHKYQFDEKDQDYLNKIRLELLFEWALESEGN